WGGRSDRGWKAGVSPYLALFPTPSAAGRPDDANYVPARRRAAPAAFGCGRPPAADRAGGGGASWPRSGQRRGPGPGLTNALRHAQASAVVVALSFAEAELWRCVSDDGQGFEREALLPTEGFGLTGMQERAGLIGAQLTVASQPGSGTRVEVTWRVPPG